MLSHLRIQLLLVVLTLFLCAVLYPLAVLGVAGLLFPFRANGSLVGLDGRPAGLGKAVGSSQIAQSFEGGEWFQSRPSAASYNAAASGGSNWGANNPMFRDRVARQLGPVVRYASGPKTGQRVGPDIERWFAERPDRTAAWARDYPTLAGAWVRADDLHKSYVSRWAEDHPEVLDAWRRANPGREHDVAKPEELAAEFFASYARAHPGTWPSIVEARTPEGKVEKRVRPVREGPDIQATFFEPWLQAHPQTNLEKVPADMVTSSGSGLDPHVTLRNARYQLDRVAPAQAARTGADPARVRSAIEAVLNKHAFRPLGGLTGSEPLVNVLEVNLAVRAAMKALTSGR